MTRCNQQSPPHKQRNYKLAALGMTLALLCASGAQAAGKKSMSDEDRQYQQERSTCLNGQSNQDRATCLREAEAAHQQARQGKLDDSRQTQYRQNALSRCKAVPERDQADCQRRIDNPDAVEGNALDGGILRKSITIVPGTPDQQPQPQ